MRKKAEALVPLSRRGRPPAQGSWSHRLVRPLVRPLIGTAVEPNHLTTLRLLTALAACAAFAIGTPSSNLWGGVLWTVSALLDRADGELARLSGKMSACGHRYDYMTDVLANSLFFVAVGFGLRSVASLGAASVPLGCIGGIGVALASIFSEQLEQGDPAGGKAYAGAAGFDFDDIAYLFGPAAWLGMLQPLLLGASLGGPIFALLTWWRLNRRRQPERTAQPKRPVT